MLVVDLMQDPLAIRFIGALVEELGCDVFESTLRVK